MAFEARKVRGRAAKLQAQRRGTTPWGVRLGLKVRLGCPIRWVLAAGAFEPVNPPGKFF